jgi:hypothetical protein
MKELEYAMKNLKTAIYFVVLIIISACETNYYPEEIAFDPDVSSTRLEVGDSIIFTDYSYGALSRVWTFEGGLPATSNDREVVVFFAESGQFTCTIETAFPDGITETKEFLIIVGSTVEIYEGFKDPAVFSFEDETSAMGVWSKWENDGMADLTIDTGTGANGTSQSAKLSFTQAGEVQIFTNQAPVGVNASMDKLKIYEFSFWAKASQNTVITAALENASNTQDFHNYLWKEQNVGTEWTQYTFSIDPSSQPYDIAGNVYIKIKMQPGISPIDIWFDEFSLIEIVQIDGFEDKDIFSFEDENSAMDVWGVWENDGEATFSIETAEGANATSQSGKVSFTTAGEVQIFTTNAQPGINATIDKTKTYEYSFWAKTSETTTITAALENSSASQDFYNYLWQDQEIDTEWTKYSFVIDPSNQPYDIATNVYIKIKMVASNSSAIFWYDEFVLEEN